MKRVLCIPVTVPDFALYTVMLYMQFASNTEHPHTTPSSRPCSHPERRACHHVPSLPFTTRMNLATSLSRALLSPAGYKPCRYGIMSSGRHRCRVRKRSEKRVAVCSGKACTGKYVTSLAGVWKADGGGSFSR